VEDEIKAAEAGSGGVERLGHRYLVGSCALACDGLTAATLYVENDVLGDAHIDRVVCNDGYTVAHQYGRYAAAYRRVGGGNDRHPGAA
jgi:hypothetical protein